MEENKNKLNSFMKEYKIINGLLELAEIEKNKLLDNLKKTQAGAFYLSLDEEKRQEFAVIYSDSNITNYLFNQERIKILEEKKKNLLKEIITSDCFPFHNDKLHIYIKNGNDTFNALDDKSTVNLNLSDELKLFIQKIIDEVYNIEDEYTVSDIPLIKVLYDKLKEEKNLNSEILTRVKRIHYQDKNHISYRLPDIDYRFKNLQHTLEDERKIIEKSDSDYKKLLLEMNLTVYYEYLMLAGNNINSIYKELPKDNSEIHLSALIKAYNNLTDLKFRIRSGYFGYYSGNPEYADFETANPEINRQILEMKKR